MNPVFRLLLTVLMLFGATGILSAQEPPLERRLDLELKDASLDDALNAIMKETSALFLYKSNEINLSGPFTISVRNATIAEVLDIIIADKDVTYSASGNQIILKKKSQASEVAPPSDRLTRGTVTDASGLGIIGQNKLYRI